MKTKLTGIRQTSSRFGVAFVAVLATMMVLPKMAWADPTALQEESAPGTVIAETSGVLTPSNDLISPGSWSEVVIQDASTGGLDFYFQFTLGTTTTDGDELETAAMGNFKTWTTGEFYTVDGLTGSGLTEPSDGTAPAPATAGLDGITVNFGWDDDGLTSGDTSYWLAITTDAPTVTLGTLSVQDTFQEGTSEILAPIPEPMTLLFGVAIACVIGVQLIRKAGVQGLWPENKSLAV